MGRMVQEVEFEEWFEGRVCKQLVTCCKGNLSLHRCVKLMSYTAQRHACFPNHIIRALLTMQQHWSFP